MRAPAAWVLAWLALLPAGEALAADAAFRFEELAVTMPSEFSERHTAAPSLPGSTVRDIVLKAPGPPGRTHNVVQFRAGIVPGLEPFKVQEDSLDLANEVIGWRLEEMRTRWDEHHRTYAQVVTLGGLTAVKGPWVGAQQGHRMNGVKYILVIGAKMIEIDVMGPGEKPDDTLLRAIRAIEKLRVLAH